MKQVRWAGLLLLMAGSFFGCVSTGAGSAYKSAAEIPIEVFFKNANKTAFQISPNGKMISYMQSWNDRMNVFVQTLGSKKVVRVTSASERDIAGYFWANNTTIAFVQDSGGDENYRLYTVKSDGSDEKNLTPFDGIRVSIIDSLENDDAHMLIGMNKRNPQIFDVYRINIETGKMTVVAENPGNISGWMTDHDGKLRIATVTDGVNTGVLYRKTEKDPFEMIMQTNFKDSFSPVLMTFDNKNLYVLSNIGRDTTGLYEFNPETKKMGKLLYANDEVDVGSVLYSEERKKLTGVAYVTDKRAYHFFDEQRAALQKKLEKRFPNVETAVTGGSRNEDIFIIRTFSDKTSGAYYVYNTVSDKLDFLADVSPWIPVDQMAEMRPIRYTASDGEVIHGYLTLPKGKENAKNLPVIVNPHGGPWARDYWGYNPQVQFLASRGYAVFQMNFRGSVGYGRKFWEKGFKQWGLKMQDDITDGVKWLIKQGIADPDRIAIYGASYGGYAVLSGVTTTPDLYCCGIDYVGVSNLFTLFETLPPYWEQGRKMMYEMIGSPETEKELLKKASPIYHIDNIVCPLFVAQGANDVRVKKEHSDQIVESLRKKNIAVEYMVKENEGHGFQNQENRFDFYRAMEKFLKEHL